jgi:NAD(P)-dependent dehydrogenase (short-subunit alcohol dehydrogenase family)
MSPQIVLVTGASSGFGRLSAEALARHGHQVFAGLRDPDGRNQHAAADLKELAERENLDLHVVQLDVTDQNSSDQAVAAVIAAAGGLDVVLNNAGMIFPGPTEAFSAEDAARQLDVNVLGALRVNRAALPQLRGQGHGLLIQMGSVGSLVSLPFSGLYSASKAALGSLTEAWRHELAPFGVESVLLAPASYPTNIGTNAAFPTDAARLEPYGEAMNRYVGDLVARTGAIAGDPQEVADAVVSLVDTERGQRRHITVLGPQQQVEAAAELARVKTATTRTVATDMGIAAFLAAAERSGARD